jgi:hypothetical protein
VQGVTNHHPHHTTVGSGPAFGTVVAVEKLLTTEHAEVVELRIRLLADLGHCERLS